MMLILICENEIKEDDIDKEFGTVETDKRKIRLAQLNLHLTLSLRFLINIGINFCLRMWKQLSTLLIRNMDLMLRVII